MEMECINQKIPSCNCDEKHEDIIKFLGVRIKLN